MTNPATINAPPTSVAEVALSPATINAINDVTKGVTNI